MYTVRFQVPQLRPDVARFATAAEADRSCNTLANKMHHGRPIRLTVSHQGEVIYSYERK